MNPVWALKMRAHYLASVLRDATATPEEQALAETELIELKELLLEMGSLRESGGGRRSEAPNEVAPDIS